jgi:hypothetical protein
MCWREGGKREQWRLVKGTKKGQLTLSMGPARVEIHFFVQRATIPSKRVIFFTFIQITYANNIVYMLAMLYVVKIYSLLCRLKINHLTEIWNMRLFLAQWFVRLRTAMYLRIIQVDI